MTAPLAGTEKQIAWATDIRAACLPKWQGAVEQQAIDAGDDEWGNQLLAVMKAILAAAERNTDAAAWINSRDGISYLIDTHNLRASLGVSRQPFRAALSILDSAGRAD